MQENSTKNVKDLNSSEIVEFQNKMLEIFTYFKEFCEEHNIKFFVMGGCAIGAVRHKGFIPWDDDIDCGMLRKDYEKFKDLWDKYGDKDKYTYCRTDREKNFHNAGASLRDNNTTFINTHSVNEDICHGIALEIIPFDGRPKNILKKYWQLSNQFIFSLFNFQRLPDNKGKFFRNAAKVAFTIVKSKKLRDSIWIFSEKQLSKYDVDECEYVTEMVGNPRVMKTNLPKEWFTEQVYLDFENIKVPMMKGYKEYLTLAFGDYMKLPPEDKRVAKHDTVYMSTTEPYTKFKGEYYCVNNE